MGPTHPHIKRTSPPSELVTIVLAALMATRAALAAMGHKDVQLAMLGFCALAGHYLLQSCLLQRARLLRCLLQRAQSAEPALKRRQRPATDRLNNNSTVR